MARTVSRVLNDNNNASPRPDDTQLQRWIDNSRDNNQNRDKRAWERSVRRGNGTPSTGRLAISAEKKTTAKHNKN